ncbi:MAG: 2-hydroxyacyl-CoA dehydratase family protein [Thermoplasmata archaeon]|nr:2-hydroxyacyl-CoA dehydratase [Thermoplasmatales archaeon]PMP73722.1 MAG: 2-hydroxyglutaryl-CoA dehydratase [Aciduliprofundum sp.]
MRVGITTTVPLEPIIAGSHIPTDLNNIFITSKDPENYVSRAEVDGFPYNSCSWIKGLYTASIEGKFDAVIGVVRGDCSNTESLLDFLQFRGIKVIPFTYPYDRSRRKMEDELKSFMEVLGSDRDRLSEVIREVDDARRIAWRIDEMTVEDRVSGYENHYYLVNTSDFLGDISRYKDIAIKFINEAERRDRIEYNLRLGYIGVPPIFTDIYQFLENNGVHVVYNEVQRQFSMPFPDSDWIDKYIMYTYPYSVYDRLRDIKNEIRRRKIEGIIHYVQSFCHRQIIDYVIKDSLDIPVLTIEGNRPGKLDERTKIRIESFIDMLL